MEKIPTIARKRTSIVFLIVALVGLRAAYAADVVRLKNHVPREVQTSTPLERVAPDAAIALSLAVQLDSKLLDQTLQELYGKNASKTKHFLSSAEFAQARERFFVPMIPIR